MKRRVVIEVTNLDTNPAQEDALVDAIWLAIKARHSHADIAATAGPEEESA